MADREIVRVDDVAGAAAERIAARVQAGGSIVLSGGCTPRAAHEKVAQLELDWSQASIWFGDDRAVAPDHEHSNFRMAKESLLDHIEGPMPEVHRIRGELGPRRPQPPTRPTCTKPSAHRAHPPSTCCCWASAPTGTRHPCSPVTPRFRSAGGSPPGSPCRAWPPWFRA
jgi:hypothetical protein